MGARVELLGRDVELAVAEEFFVARDRLPAALVVRGEAGIGKTSVWREGVRMAHERGLCVLVAAPGESEAQVSFAALGDLLSDVLGPVLGELPAQQRRALEVALRIARVDPGVSARFDEGAVSFAFLSALRGLAADAPVLVAVDDVQWLDVASARALSFAVRRLGGDRIGLFLSQRVEREDPVALGVERVLGPDRLTVLELGPLTFGAVQRLLRTTLASALPRPVLARVYELSGGNPFFALELGRARERGSITLEPGGGLPVSLEALVRDRIAALPVLTRRSLATAAAVSMPTVTLIDARCRVGTLARRWTRGSWSLTAIWSGSRIRCCGGRLTPPCRRPSATSFTGGWRAWSRTSRSRRGNSRWRVSGRTRRSPAG